MSARPMNLACLDSRSGGGGCRDLLLSQSDGHLDINSASLIPRSHYVLERITRYPEVVGSLGPTVVSRPPLPAMDAVVSNITL
jgi:hypothetical protein